MVDETGDRGSFLEKYEEVQMVKKILSKRNVFAIKIWPLN